MPPQLSSVIIKRSSNLKVLVSSCLMGNNVRWNGKNKLSSRLVTWADSEGLELIPVCPEDELLGTPRPPIKLIQIEEKINAKCKGLDISDELSKKCREIFDRHDDVIGFIGIHGSPSCGVGVGVKNLGRTIKGFMHQAAEVPTTESGYLKSDLNRQIFLRRLKKHESR